MLYTLSDLDLLSAQVSVKDHHGPLVTKHICDVSPRGLVVSPPIRFRSVKKYGLSAILHFSYHHIQSKNFAEPSLMESSHPLDGFPKK